MKGEAVRQAQRAIREAIVEQTPTQVIFDRRALERGYALLIAAEPERELESVCGKLSVGFPIKGEDYEDAPNED